MDLLSLSDAVLVFILVIAISRLDRKNGLKTVPSTVKVRSRLSSFSVITRASINKEDADI